MASFPKITFEEEGVHLRTKFSSFFFLYDEVKIMREGHILKLGNWFIGDLCIPFKRVHVSSFLKEDKQAQLKTQKESNIYILYLTPPFILYIISLILKRLSIKIDSMIWAMVWGITVTISLASFTYKAPITIKMWKLSPRQSSTLLGILAGASIYIFLTLTL